MLPLEDSALLSSRVVMYTLPPAPPPLQPLAPSMWMSLMSVGQYVLWYATAATPERTRRATNTKLAPPSLPINVATYLRVCAVALPLLVWAAAAVPYVLVLIIFLFAIVGVLYFGENEYARRARRARPDAALLSVARASLARASRCRAFACLARV